MRAISLATCMVAALGAFLVVLVAERTLAENEAKLLNDNILTSKGEVPIDFEHDNRPMPEELNDGELEAGDQHTDWTYNDQTKWAGEYPQCKGVKLRQSPIDIITDKVVFGPRMKLDFIDYDQEVEFELKNTHHSVSLTPIASLAKPAVALNFVSGQAVFELQEIHFHWGDGLVKGSEHEINDNRAAAEMHMVHYRRGVDKSQIGNTENSVAVIGVLIESDSVEHNKLEPIVKKTERVNGTNIQYKDDSPFNLYNLLPESHHAFYAYNGSLTTPPCYEVVTWIIMSEPVFMSQAALVDLSNMEAELPHLGRRKIARNFRDVQPLLNRPVYASFNASDTNTYMKLNSSQMLTDLSVQPLNSRNLKQLNLNERFKQALKNYWEKVNALPGSVRRAFKQIENARRDLWRQIRSDRLAAHRSRPNQKEFSQSLNDKDY